mgnify:CR=1 FL=1
MTIQPLTWMSLASRGRTMVALGAAGAGLMYCYYRLVHVRRKGLRGTSAKGHRRQSSEGLIATTVSGMAVATARFAHRALLHKRTRKMTYSNPVTDDEAVSERIVIAMVGLPARGKSFISKAILRYLIFLGVACKLFNAGNKRRDKGKAGADASFFDPNNKSAQEQKEQMAMETLTDMLNWLSAQRGLACGLFDATNTTVARRRAVIERCAKATPAVTLIFLESECNDESILRANYELKLTNDDYKKATTDAERQAARDDFMGRVHAYEKVYEPISDAEADAIDATPELPPLRYMKIVDAGKKVVVSRCDGDSFVCRWVVQLMHSIHLSPRRVHIVLCGQSCNDAEQIRGGDSRLSEAGLTFGKAAVETLMSRLDTTREPPVVMTGTLLRYGQMAEILREAIVRAFDLTGSSSDLIAHQSPPPSPPPGSRSASPPPSPPPASSPRTRAPPWRTDPASAESPAADSAGLPQAETERRTFFGAARQLSFERKTEKKKREEAEKKKAMPARVRRTVTFGPGPLGMVFDHVVGHATILKVSPGSQAEHQGVVVGSKVVSVAGESMEGVPRPAVMARIKEEMQRAAEKPMVLELELPSVEEAARTAAVVAEAEAEAAAKAAARTAAVVAVAEAEAAAKAVKAEEEARIAAEKAAEEKAAAAKAAAEKAAAEKEAAEKKVAAEKAAAEKEAAEKAAAEKAAAEKVENRSSLFGGRVAAIASPFESTKQEPVETAAPAEALAAMTRLRLTVTFGPGPLGMAFGQVDGYVTIFNVSSGSQAEHQGVVVGSKVVSVAGEPMEGVSRPAVMARIKEEMQRAAEKPMVLELELPSVEEAARTAAVVAEAEAAKKAAEEKAAEEKAAEEKAAAAKAAAEKAAVDKEAAEKAAEEKAAAKQAPETTAVEKVEKAAAEKVEKRSSLFGGLVAVIASPFESKKEVPVEAAAPAEAPAALTSNYASPTKSPTSPDSPTSKYASPTSPDSSARRTVTFGPGRLGLTFGEVDGCVTIHKVAPGSPGEVQGVIVGSKVVSVAGKPTEGVPHAEVVARIKEEMQRTAEKPMVLELESEAYAETATATEEVNSIAPATAEQAAMPADADLLASMVQGQERDDDADLAAAVRAAANHVAAFKTEKRVSLFGGLTAAANAAATAIAAPFESKKDAAPAPSPAPATAPAGPSAEKLAEAPAELFANLDDLEEKAAKEKAAKEKAAKEKAAAEKEAAEKEAAEKAAAEKAAAEKVENRSSLFGGRVAAIASPFESTKQEPVETAAPAEALAAMTRLRLTVTFGPGPLGMAFGQVDGYVTIFNVSSGSQAEHQGVVVGSKVVSVAGEPMEGVSRPAVMARIKEEMQRAAEKPMVLELELPSVEEAARTAAVVAEAEAVKKTAEENAAASTASSIPSRSSLRSRARNLPVHESRNLNELCFGSLEGLQGGRLRDFFPEEYELREADRLNYRYPGVGGQSYYDLIVQIRAVLLTIEASRRDAVVVCDLAVARVLLGYFQGHPIAGIPDLDVPPGVVELSRTHAGFSRTDFPVHVGLASMLANLR